MNFKYGSRKEPETKEVETRSQVHLLIMLYSLGIQLPENITKFCRAWYLKLKELKESILHE